MTRFQIPLASILLIASLAPAVLWPSLARHVAADHLGTGYGLMTMLQNAGLTLANVIVGHLNDSGSASAAHVQGYAAMLWFFGLLSLTGFPFCCAALAARSVPTIPHSRAPSIMRLMPDR